MATTARQVERARGGAIRTFWDTSVGKKAVMAVSGLVWIAFVIAHMIGNLQVFQGSERLNAYSALLHGPLNEVLWGMRVVLAAALLLHVTAAYQLTRRDRAARPTDYALRKPQVSTFASRTIRWGGVVILMFLVFHILHLTTGTIRPAGVFIPGDVYTNLVEGFRVWWVTALYLVAMVALGLHLYHGVWSSARTMGITPPAGQPLRRPAAVVLAIVVAVGFALVPLAVVAGLVE